MANSGAAGNVGRLDAGWDWNWPLKDWTWEGRSFRERSGLSISLGMNRRHKLIFSDLFTYWFLPAEETETQKLNHLPKATELASGKIKIPIPKQGG